jgi:hypothetical protein
LQACSTPPREPVLPPRLAIFVYIHVFFVRCSQREESRVRFLPALTAIASSVGLYA